jgi:phage replication-related protein YjqB (UPF0714/DUF867 family)
LDVFSPNHEILEGQQMPRDTAVVAGLKATITRLKNQRDALKKEQKLRDAGFKATIARLKNQLETLKREQKLRDAGFKAAIARLKNQLAAKETKQK